MKSPHAQPTLDLLPAQDLSDTAFVYWVLSQGPATNLDILRRSFQARGFGLTVHSRVADVRKRYGVQVTCEGPLHRPGCRKPAYLYTLTEKMR